MANNRELLRYPELRDRYSIPYTPEHLIRMEKEGRFPRRIKLSHRCVMWRAEDIEAWLDSRAAA